MTVSSLCSATFVGTAAGSLIRCRRFFGLEALQRRPPGVEHLAVLPLGAIRQLLPRFGVETGAIRSADRLERQCQHHRIPHDGFEIHVIVSNREVESFVLRIREKLLEFDFDRELDGVEAAHALRRGDRVDLGGHQDAVVQPLQAQVDAHRSALLDGRHRLAEALGRVELEHALTHLAGAVHDVVHGHGVGAGHVRHDQRFYASP